MQPTAMIDFKLIGRFPDVCAGLINVSPFTFRIKAADVTDRIGVITTNFDKRNLTGHVDEFSRAVSTNVRQVF